MLRCGLSANIRLAEQTGTAMQGNDGTAVSLVGAVDEIETGRLHLLS
jgi:hypothetical protein